MTPAEYDLADAGTQRADAIAAFDEWSSRRRRAFWKFAVVGAVAAALGHGIVITLAACAGVGFVGATLAFHELLAAPRFAGPERLVEGARERISSRDPDVAERALSPVTYAVEGTAVALAGALAALAAMELVAWAATLG